MFNKVIDRKNASPKAIASPSFKDIVWAAGFLEGEGSFGLQKQGNFKYPLIKAAQKNVEPLIRLAFTFGGSLMNHGSKVILKDGSKQEYFDWYCYSGRAVGVMMTIYKFMSVRRKRQIKVVLDHYFNRKGGDSN